MLKLPKFSHNFIIYTLAVIYWSQGGAVRPIIPLIANEMGASPSFIGILVTARAFLPFFIAIPTGKYIDIVGCKSTLRLGVLSMFTGGLIYYLSSNFTAFIIGQTFMGVGELFYWTSLQSIATMSKDKKEQQAVIGIFSVFIAIGQFLGPMIGGYIAEKFGFHQVFLMYLIINTFGFLFIYNLIEPQRKIDGKIKLFEGFEDARIVLKRSGIQIALICTFAMLFSLSIWESFYPLLLFNHFGITTGRIGLLISIRSFSQIIIRPLMSKLIMIFGINKLVYVSVLISIIGITIVPLLGRSFFLLIVIALFSGIGLGLIMPITILMIANSTEESKRGIGMSLRLVVNRLAQLINPLIFGLMVELFGMIASFYIMGLGLFAVVGGTSIHLFSQIKKKESDEVF